MRQRLDDLAARLHKREGGRRVRRENLHVTLAFLGTTPVAKLTCVREAAAGVHGEAFELSLDTVGHWRRPRVVWAGSSSIPSGLKEFVRDLNNRLRKCGFTPEERPYQVHATLLRKVAHMRSAVAVDPIEWQVKGFALVESITRPEGVTYEVLESWALNA